MRFNKAAGELTLPEEGVEEVKLSHGSGAVMAKFKRLEQEKPATIGSTDKFKVNVEYSVHKKKRHMTFKLDFMCLNEIAKGTTEKVNIYLSFEGLEDKTFCMNREFIFKKAKKGKTKEETLVKKLLISNKLISKKILAFAE